MNSNRLKKVEAEFDRLSRLFREKKVGRRSYIRALKKLTVRDDRGNYWMIGASTGKWYQYQGGEWLAADPYHPFKTAEGNKRGYTTAHFFSVVSLVIANLFPFIGLAFFQWELSTVIFLYWMENLVIGCWNLLKMKKAQGKNVHSHFTINSAQARNLSRRQVIQFFLFHYGMFTLGHGVFVVIFFGLPDGGWSWVAVSFIFLFLSHGISYFKNFIKGGEYLNNSYQNLFLQPYGRVFILHFIVVTGGWWINKLESTSTAVIILIIGKIAIDIFAHLWERKKFMGQPS